MRPPAETEMEWFAYLATPYSREEDKQEAFRRSAQLSMRLYAARVPHFCPVVMGHVAETYREDGLAHLTQACWLSLVMPVLTRASALIWPDLPGTPISVGMAAERDVADRLGIPVVHWKQPFEHLPGGLLQQMGRGVE